MAGNRSCVKRGVDRNTVLIWLETEAVSREALPIERCPQFRDQPPGSTATYNGKCYIFYNRQPLNFKDALSFCKSRGGTLVDESNPALQGFISWELWRRHRSDTSSQYWMGAVRDAQDRKNWKWINGEDVSVSFWNLPGGSENCARYDGSKGWLWSDTNCNSNLNYICQHQPKACGRPEQPPNSTMVAKNFNVGATIEYSCDEGHLLVGPAARTCLPTGFYNEFPPVCKRIECGFPAEIANGFYQLVNGTVSYLSKVVYSCEEGYEMAGRAQLLCDIDERWNGPPPRCLAVECEAPPSISNGRFVASNNVTIAGTIIEYLCSTRGYKLVGPKQIVCLPSGLFDKKPPICKETEDVRGGLATAPVTKPSRGPTRPTTPLPTRATSGPKKPLQRPPKEEDNVIEESAHVPSLVAPSHPQENEIPDSVNRRTDLGHIANVAHPVEEERKEAVGARLNLGAIIALGVFGGFVFLAAVITTIVILIRSGKKRKLPPARTMPPRWYTLLALPFPDQQVGRREFSRNYRNRAVIGLVFSAPDLDPMDLGFNSQLVPWVFFLRGELPQVTRVWTQLGGPLKNLPSLPTPVAALNQSAKHYRHRASPDCNTVASFDSSSSESRGGLNRYYRQAWENLHQSAGNKSAPLNHAPLRRKETLDEPAGYRNVPGTRMIGAEVLRDASELVVSDVIPPKPSAIAAAEKKRHHHHHHHHGGAGGARETQVDWRQQQQHARAQHKNRY
uniref:Sushi, von Willebrand factor type A, EGF and pentraxin domain-containing protein 1 n=1 Tax=Timema monikensis TaxID=170555 RepID=A0A7R9E9G7_9NEOP|nr:unnamed protein product [Timema monikensis]